MFDPMKGDWDPLPGQPDPEDAELMAQWSQGLPEAPIEERDYREADEREYYEDLAYFARKERSERDQEFTSDDLEDLDEQ